MIKKHNHDIDHQKHLPNQKSKPLLFILTAPPYLYSRSTISSNFRSLFKNKDKPLVAAKYHSHQSSISNIINLTPITTPLTSQPPQKALKQQNQAPYTPFSRIFALFINSLKPSYQITYHRKSTRDYQFKGTLKPLPPTHHPQLRSHPLVV